jgi:CBS domain containing-hemolysin-like protein
MNLNHIWINLFGTTQWFGVDMVFLVSMLLCAIVVILMNVVFWGMKPKRKAVKATAPFSVFFAPLLKDGASHIIICSISQ